MRLLLMFVIGALVLGCSSSRESVSAKNAVLYRDTDILAVDYKLYHQKADSSLLYVKINTENLLYSKTRSEVFSAFVKISIRIVDNTLTPFVADSLSFTLVDEDEKKMPKDLIASFWLPLQAQKSYSLDIKFVDVNKNAGKGIKVSLDKANTNSAENFLVTSAESGLPIFGDRVVSGKQYLIHINEQTNCYGRYYNRNFPLPPPPFAMYQPKPFNYAADSTFVLNSASQFYFTAPEEGFFHFAKDSTQKQGLTLFSANNEFPYVKTVKSMTEPFRYLVSRKEYEQVYVAADKKAAIEEFWREWTGSTERARSSIEEFYKRVEKANVNFTSYVEGWKSDRGLIFIIFGPPNGVYQSEFVESWVYGEENNPMSITFNFVKVINPFTENDYRLNREETYKPAWYRAMEIWRTGRAY